ncbi:MAG: hypothetical protein HC771_06770 [Synechococcales cyanobacterium CRU_2_2]|nr:hypothetical protein [Synechococcales cyanobacterium CRU_2_2]
MAESMRVKSIAAQWMEKYREKPLARNLRRDLLFGLLMTWMVFCSGDAPVRPQDNSR